MRVSENGGIPEAIVEVTDGSASSPQILPGGTHVLFTFRSREENQIAVWSLESGAQKLLFAGTGARYVQTGHLIYSLNAAIFAVAFDPRTLDVTGGPVPMVDGPGPRDFAVSNSGALAFLDQEGTALELAWVDRQGNVEPLAVGAGQYINPRLSPDGQKLAVAIADAAGPDIWIYDLHRR